MRKIDSDQVFAALCSFYVANRDIRGVVPYAVINGIEVSERDVMLKHHLANRTKSPWTHQDGVAALLQLNPWLKDMEWWDLYVNEDAFDAYMSINYPGIRTPPRFVRPIRAR